MSFDAGQITATLDLDRSPFTRSLGAARKSAADFARQVYQATLGTDQGDVSAGVKQAEAIAKRYAGQAYDAVLGVDYASVRGDTAAAERIAQNFARQSYEAALGIRGTTGVLAELKTADAAADRLDGRNVTVDVDSDGRGAAHLQSLSGGFKSLAGNIRATGTVLAASTIPFAIAGIGAATPAVLALGASLAGLALNLGKAATGFSLVGAAAAGGALVGLKAYGTAIAGVVTQGASLEQNLLAARTAMDGANQSVKAARDALAEAKPGTEEYVLAQQQLTTALEQQQQALKEWRRQQALNTPAARAFSDQLDKTRLVLAKLSGAIGSRIFPAFTHELDAWNGVLREMRPFIADTAGRIAQIAAGFSRWFRTADDGQVLREVVGFLSQSAVRAASGLSQIAQIGVSAFRPLIPLAGELQKNVLGILSATNRWVQSAEGQKRLGQIYRGLWNDAKKLWPVVRDLAISVGQFFKLLDRTGIADQASKGLRTFAHWLREATQRGGGLEDFLRNAKALMPFVGHAVVAVAGAIGKIATAVIGARQAGHKLTILQEIFRGIGNAAKPLQGLVIGTFRDLGPVVRDLLPPLARFFGTFAGSSGPLVTFVNTLTSVLKAFNHLPKPVRETAAKLLALKIILGGLGIGAVVGPMGRFASNMLLARGAAAKLAGKSALLGVAGGLAGIAAVLAGGIGLGVLFFGLKRAYDKNEEFRKSVNRLRDKALQAFGGIRKQIDNQVIPALARLADKGAKFLIDIFDLDGGQRKKIRTAGGQAVNTYGNTLNEAAKRSADHGPAYEAGFKLGKGVRHGLADAVRVRDGAFQIKWSRILGLSGKGDDPTATIRGAVLRAINPLAIFQPVVGKLTKGWRDAFRGTPWGKIAQSFFTGQLIFGELGQRLNRALNHLGLKGTGKNIVRIIASGFNPAFLGIALVDAVKSAANKLFNWVTGHHGDFKKSGKNAGGGFLEGFREMLSPGGIVNVGKKAYDAFRKWQKEHSPSKLWAQSGKNAALGYLKGFRDTKIGDGIARELQGAMKRNAAELGRAGDVGGIRGLELRSALLGKRAHLALAAGDTDLAQEIRVRLARLKTRQRRLASSARRMAGQLGPGDPGYLDDGFRANSRQSAHRGDHGYVQAEDGSWVYNPALYRKQQRNNATHRYLRGGQGRLHGGPRGEGSRPHRGITKDEMRDVQRETNRELVSGIGSHISRAMANGMTHEEIDRAMSASLHHFNAAGANPR